LRSRAVGATFRCVLLTVRAGPYTIRGVSMGGIHTALHVPELGVLLDIGIALRAFQGVDTLCISHGHADHVGALGALLGMRGLARSGPLRVLAPAATVPDLRDAMTALGRLQRHPLGVDWVPLEPGDTVTLRPDLRVRAFRTHHPVPSLGYLFHQPVRKLRVEHLGLAREEIARRRLAGDDTLFEELERPLLAYATDTLPRVLDTAPALRDVPVLLLECSFLDDRKSVADARAGGHVHLDDLLPYAADLRVGALVLMHLSQLHQPDEIRAILAERLPPGLHERCVPFVPPGATWP
jgi:ribonuclease Z